MGFVCSMVLSGYVTSRAYLNKYKLEMREALNLSNRKLRINGRKVSSISSFVFAFLISFYIFERPAFAQGGSIYICANRSTNSITLRSKCRKSEERVRNYSQLKGEKGDAGLKGERGETGLTGEKGDNGIDGSDAPSIYGDGSAGEIRGSTGFQMLDVSNPQFSDLNIASNESLYIESGSIIRLKGNFNNQGSLIIGTGAMSNVAEFASEDDLIAPSLGGADKGISARAPRMGESASQLGSFRMGGYRGLGRKYLTTSGTAITLPGLVGGAAGSPGRTYSALGNSSNDTEGGKGGGTVVFLVKGEVNNSGNIVAQGGSAALAKGAGGGGGGVIIIASPESILNAGSIYVNGGEGGRSSASSGPGGGGGGGLVRLISPKVTNSGTINISGGAAGLNNPSSATHVPIMAGSGGGGSMGDGGMGADIYPDNTYGPASDGSEGLSLTTTIDPAILYR